jgi:hypothetical protein
VDAEQARPRAEPNLVVDWVMAGLGCWFVAGGYLVAWSQLRPGGTANPLAAWQQVFADSGWILVTGFLAATLARNLSRGMPWQRVLPPGYELSLAGCLLFGMAAVADTYWSLAFGFSSGLEALLTPTHIVEILGGGLMVSGPLRSGLQRGSLGLPAIISGGLVLSTLTFGTLFIDPYVDTWASASRQPVPVTWWVGQNLGLAGLVVQPVLLLGILLFLLLNFRPRPGTFTLIATLNGFMVAIVGVRFDLLPAMVATGVGADLLALALRPARDRPLRLRLFASAVPALYVACYLGALLLAGGSAWSWRLWLGLLLGAPVLGWLLAGLASLGAGGLRTSLAPAAEAHWPRHYETEVSPDQVKEALEQLQDPARLAASPLARLACISRDGREPDAELRSLLTDVIRELAGSRQPRDAEAGQLLLDYYVKRTGSHEVIAERLHLSRPTFYRRLQRGLALVAERIDELSEFAARQG